MLLRFASLVAIRDWKVCFALQDSLLLAEMRMRCVSMPFGSQNNVEPIMITHCVALADT